MGYFGEDALWSKYGLLWRKSIRLGYFGEDALWRKYGLLWRKSIRLGYFGGTFDWWLTVTRTIGYCYFNLFNCHNGLLWRRIWLAPEDPQEPIRFFTKVALLLSVRSFVKVFVMENRKIGGQCLKNLLFH